MQNKQRLELADYEAENLARLQKMFSRKWEFIFMQAEAQAKYVFSQYLSKLSSDHAISTRRCQKTKRSLFWPRCDLCFRVDKKRDKLERKVLDSQERAFWDVHRPAVRELILRPQMACWELHVYPAIPVATHWSWLGCVVPAAWLCEHDRGRHQEGVSHDQIRRCWRRRRRRHRHSPRQTTSQQGEYEKEHSALQGQKGFHTHIWKVVLSFALFFAGGGLSEEIPKCCSGEEGMLSSESLSICQARPAIRAAAPTASSVQLHVLARVNLRNINVEQLYEPRSSRARSITTALPWPCWNWLDFESWLWWVQSFVWWEFHVKRTSSQLLTNVKLVLYLARHITSTR